MKTTQQDNETTSKAAHTPGEWRLILAPTQIVTDEKVICNINHIHLPEHQGFANARLIAAAPAMLEALEHCERLSNCQADDFQSLSLAMGEIKTIALHAIRQARGEA